MHTGTLSAYVIEYQSPVLTATHHSYGSLA